MWHPVDQQIPLCTIAGGKQGREHNVTLVFLLREHLSSLEKIKWSVGAVGCSPSVHQILGLKKGLDSLCFFTRFRVNQRLALSGEWEIWKPQSLERASQKLLENRENLPGLSPRRLESKKSKVISVHCWNELAAWQYAQLRDGIRTPLWSICSKLSVRSDTKIWCVLQKEPLFFTWGLHCTTDAVKCPHCISVPKHGFPMWQYKTGDVFSCPVCSETKRNIVYWLVIFVDNAFCYLHILVSPEKQGSA